MALAGDQLAAGFSLGACRIFPNRNVVTLGDETVSLEPKIMDVCCLLASRSGEVVSRVDLIDQVWGVSFGSDESLTRAIYLLRKAMAHVSGFPAPIETVSKKGYRLAVAAMPFDGPAAMAPTLARIAADTRPSIAVLAFTDMSRLGDQGYFADGIAEEIINALTTVRGIRVVGRTSSFSFKENNIPISEIGVALGVDHILEGSVRKQGAQLRISAQLIEVANDSHLWSHNYNGTVDSAFDLQDEIALSVCEKLKVILHLDDDFSRLAPARLPLSTLAFFAHS